MSNKYGARKTTVDGVVFASAAEARRYGELKLMALGGLIRDLECHPRYRLEVNGVLIGNYTGDFSYVDEHGVLTVEDVKSPASKTEAYGLRKRLMRALHRIEITEVMG